MGLIAMGQGPMVFESILIYHMQMASGVMDLFAILQMQKIGFQFEPQGMQPNLTCYGK